VTCGGVDLEDAGTCRQSTGWDDNTEGLRRLVLVPWRQSSNMQVTSSAGARAPASGTHRNRIVLSQCQCSRWSVLLLRNNEHLLQPGWRL